MTISMTIIFKVKENYSQESKQLR